MKVQESTRKNIIEYLLRRDNQFHGKMGIVQFLNQIWSLPNLPSTDDRCPNMEKDIEQHMVYFNDWTYSNLLYDSRLGLLKTDDNTFIKFVEYCVHPRATYKDEHKIKLVSEINELLNGDKLQLEETGNFCGSSVYTIQSTQNDLKRTEGEYEVVLSFAGENRDYVEAVARYLKAKKVSVFYDNDEEVELWGKELTEHLDTIYNGNARFCVMFISKYYAEKMWTTHERRSALDKALTKNEYILPARFDNTEITGLRASIGYTDLSNKTPVQLGELILKKLGRDV